MPTKTAQLIAALFCVALLGVVVAVLPAQDAAPAKPTKVAHVVTPNGIVRVCEDVLTYQPHSGVRHQVASNDTHTWVILAHRSVQVGGYVMTGSGTPAAIYEIDHANPDTAPAHYYFGEVGDSGLDNHNQPQVVIAPDGHLIAVLAGHDDPILIERSKAPGTVTKGFAPLSIIADDIDRPSVGGSYPALAVFGDMMHVVYRSTERKYSYDLCHVSVNLVTGEVSKRTTIASTAPGIDWQSGRKHEWYHDLVIDPDTGAMFVTTKPTSGPTGLAGDDTDIIYYPPATYISRDQGETWRQTQG